MTACCNGHVKIMRILLLSESPAGDGRGASVTSDAADKARRIWLTEAINAEGETALWLACYWGCPQVRRPSGRRLLHRRVSLASSATIWPQMMQPLMGNTGILYQCFLSPHQIVSLFLLVSSLLYRQAVGLLLAAGGGVATVRVRDRVTGLTPRGVAMREGSDLMRIEVREARVPITARMMLEFVLHRRSITICCLSFFRASACSIPFA